MNKIVTVIVGVLVLVLIILQVVGPSRPEVLEETPDDLLLTEEIPDQIAFTLKTACYDCHSMKTKYPWYGYVAPISWFLIDHIAEGREELNFSYWRQLSKREKLRALKDIQEEVEEGEMPLESYVVVHSEAELTDDQRKELVAWAKGLANEVLK